MTTYAFEATPVQEKLMDYVTDGRYNYIGFGGGIRGTKTWGTLAVLIALCRVFPGYRAAVIRKDLERIRKSTLPSFNKLRRLTNGFVGPVNLQTFEAQCKNGSVIILRGENIDRDPDLDSFDGYEVNAFDLEEADELREATFNKAIERAGAWIIPDAMEQPPPLVMATFNPNAGWPKRVWYDPWEQGTIAPPYAFVPATIADNPYAGAEYQESLKNLPPEEYKLRVIGDWTQLSGRYYRSLNKAVHLIPRSHLPEKLPEWWEYWGAYDWGYGHWGVFGAFCRDPDGVTYLLASIWMRQEQDDVQAKTILAAVKDGKIPADCTQEVYAGADCWSAVMARGGSGITTAEVFDEHGIYLIPADTDRINGGRAVRRALEVREGRAGFYIIENAKDEPNDRGNNRVFEQLAGTMPDPNNINKPEKVDADSNGRGGDDGADCARYGLATRYETPKMPYAETELAKERAKLDQASRREAEGFDSYVAKLGKRKAVVP